MKVIILCGGMGTRLKEETVFKPKAMVEVGGKPILWHIMKTYAHYGFNEFILALGYKKNYIKEYFINQKLFSSDFLLSTKDNKTKFYSNDNSDNFKITFVDTGDETLPGERILKCEKYISKKDKYFMVTYSDGVTDLNIKNLFSFHKKQKTIGTILGVHPRSKFGLVKIDSSNIVKNFLEKPVLSDWINGGYMVFNRSFFKYLKPNEMEYDGLKRIIEKKQLSLFKHDGFWYAVDTYKELDELNKIWKINPIWKVWK